MARKGASLHELMKIATLIALFLGLASGFGAQMIDPLSVTSLYLFEPLPSSTNGAGLTGTGFVYAYKGSNYLVSNWHVFSGRNWPNIEPKDTNGSVPTNVIIFYILKTLNGRVGITEPLYDTNGVPLWMEDSTGGTNIDVAVLPLTVQDSHAQVYPLNEAVHVDDMLLEPTMSVSIIGFPGNLTTPMDFPVWKTGNIASDPDVDYRGTPVLLVSAVVRPGMSGSPVIARSIGGYTTKGGHSIGIGNFDQFIGIFSAYQPDNEIAYVWKAKVISEILEHGRRGTTVIKR